MASDGETSGDGTSLKDRVAARTARLAEPSREPAPIAPLPGQMELFPERDEPEAPALNGPATIPEAAIADRRLADVDYLVLALLAALADPEGRCRTTDAVLSAMTAGRPGPKSMAGVIARLATLGYVRVEAGDDGRVVILPPRG